MLTRFRILAIPTLLLVFSTSFLLSCKKTEIEEIDSDTEVTSKWADLTLEIIRKSMYKSPTYSSRSLGYMGLVMYECVVHADSTLRSMDGQLNGLTNLPLPQNNSEYNWLIVLNAGQQTLLKLLYPKSLNLSPENFDRIDSLYNRILSERSVGIAQPIIDRSVQLGGDIALSIYNWSQTDGGHYGFQKNFDPAYVFPQGPSHWVPPIAGQTISSFPLHPYWGNNRTFVTENNNLPIPSIIPYSTDPASDYYKLYQDVYIKNLNLTAEEKEIAAWWADDPTETFSPPGHSYHLATLAIKKSGAKYVKAAETYARVGMAVADAFINCWKAKVVYFNERPSSFVRANINPRWTQYWPEPPFPAFPSGHSTQSAAAAIVLTSMYGDNFSFTDDSHAGAKRFSAELKFKPRHFESFWAMAEESALSRFLGGIHTRQDNAVGLEQGKKIGGNVNALLWRK